MSRQYPQIIYWKWDRQTLEERLYLPKIEELCRRSVFDHIYISLVWTEHEITETLCRDAIAEAADALHRRGRKIVFDLDVRSARWTFAGKYPQALLQLLTPHEAVLDKAGRAAFRFQEGSSGDHYGEYPVLASRHLRTLLFDRDENGCYNPDSLTPIEPRTLEIHKPGQVTVGIDAGRENAGRSILSSVVHTYQYPDPFSPELREFHKQLFQLYADTDIDGACLDEWGFPPYPGFSFSRAWRHPWYGAALAKAYQAETDRDLLDDVLNILHGPSGDPSLQTRVIHDYTDLIRARHASIEAWFYRKVKETFGDDAFVGVHPTWFAIHKTRCAMEIWKNGFNWYSVLRDFGQTDEIAPFPVRLALAHKWGSRPFYNMCYSMETRDIRIYIREMWENARYGGRTHLLSYECEREKAGMLQLREGNDLESVSRVAERIGLLDEVQTAVPRSNVLVILGYGAAVDWRVNRIVEGHWDLDGGPFVEAFEVAQSLWENSYLCDLAASYEIDSGALKLNSDGLPVYGGNSYEAAIYVRPEFASQEEIQFLAGHRPDRLWVFGDLTRDRNGSNVAVTAGEIRKRCHWSSWTRMPLEVDRDLRRAGIQPNDIDNGSRMADGLVVITSHTSKPDGTPLDIRIDIDGFEVTAEAKDLFAIKLHPGGSIAKLAAGDLAWVAVDGEIRWREDPPRDVILKGTSDGELEAVI